MIYWEGGEKHYHSETITYSPRTRKWTRLPYLPRTGAYGASAVMRDRRGNEQLLIAGGSNENGATSEGFRLIKEKGKFVWKRLSPLPKPLTGASGAVIGNSFYVFGGAPSFEESGLKSASNTLFELTFYNGLNPDNRWREISASNPPPARVGAAAVACEKRLFIFGGYGLQADGTLGNFKDAYVLDLSKPGIRVWKQIADLPFPIRWATAIALDSGRIGIFGGYAESFLDKSFIYHIEKDTYYAYTPIPKATAVMSSGISKDGIIYLAGGEDEPKHRSKSFFIGRWRHN
ncbi:MAG: kelch repeat-containing protein [Armatimonadota bacterium]|nr:kelch repeat-containing protein [Armatimonadota bacterium]